MYSKLLHIFLLFNAALLLPSCQNDIIDDDDLQGSEIEFAIPSEESRGISLTDNASLTKKGTQFSIFGDKTYLSENNDLNGLYTVFFNTTVTSQGNNKWTYAPLQYWFPNNEYSFVAVHPSLSNMASVTDIQYSDSRLTFTFNADLDGNGSVKNDDFTDIIVAAHRRRTGSFPVGQAKPKNVNVTLQFHHMMSLIDIEASVYDSLMYVGDDESRLDPDPDYNDPIIKNEFIQIRKVEFYGFKPKANFSFRPVDLDNGAQETSDLTGSIDVDYNAGWANMLIEIPEAQAAHIVNSGPDVNGILKIFKTSIFSNTKDAIIMIPQTLSEDAKLVIGYSVNTDSYKSDDMRTVTIPISTVDPQSGEKKAMVLKPLKKYTLSFTIDKVYKGQIKPGSLEWTVTDLSDTNANNRWISENDTIRQSFIQ